MTAHIDLPPEGREVAPGVWEYPPARPDLYRHRGSGLTVDAVRLTEGNGGQVWEWADSKPRWEGGRIVGLTVFTATNRRVPAEFGDWVTYTRTLGFRVVPDAEFTRDYEGVGQ